MSVQWDIHIHTKMGNAVVRKHLKKGLLKIIEIQYVIQKKICLKTLGKFKRFVTQALSHLTLYHLDIFYF